MRSYFGGIAYGKVVETVWTAEFDAACAELDMGEQLGATGVLKMFVYMFWVAVVGGY